AGKLGGPFPSGTFTLATLRFTPLKASAATSLTFSQQEPRQTGVYRSGVNRLQSADALTMTVGEEETPGKDDRSLFLPLVP
ncbi:MAG TPA: hypothetical protein VNK95_24200, partial [Caldilineaceae bacterium]|nr:hypothetical protein [Caldilineaceae bacterium]